MLMLSVTITTSAMTSAMTSAVTSAVTSTITTFSVFWCVIVVLENFWKIRKSIKINNRNDLHNNALHILRVYHPISLCSWIGGRVPKDWQVFRFIINNKLIFFLITILVSSKLSHWKLWFCLNLYSAKKSFIMIKK
jgi:hypothetical protein